MSRSYRCSECGGILGQHFNGCPEAPEEVDDGKEIEALGVKTSGVRIDDEPTLHPRPAADFLRQV